ncbi:MarR family winged helix-turn-helix transcriptional regulator [Paenibacillus sp. SYP-B4298]|uniref:MarR family winged helix-turn-helix transcriptional regulator n=1 Tax=Paenibacillus sp. SYP-B4298 TaxID=2996034 RepID=UPI003FA6CB28
METSRNEALSLFIALSRASQWVNAHVDRDIKSMGLNRTEFGVLELLYHKGEQPIQQIGEKVLMSSGNITYVVDKLEKKELARRRACTVDRRLTYAEITEKGKQFIEEVFPGHVDIIQRAVSGLTEQEQQQAAKLLKKLGKSAQESF